MTPLTIYTNMGMINHLTYHLTPTGMQGVGDVMSLLGFREVEPDDPHEHGYYVRWFRLASGPLVHYVTDKEQERIGDMLELGHFCVIVPAPVYRRARESGWCVRDSGSGRIWLEHDRVRIEVRSS